MASEDSKPFSRLRVPTRIVTGLIAAAIVALLLWTAGSTGDPATFTEVKSDYYNLLVAGFRDGHLHMKVTPDPRLGPGRPTEAPRAGADYLLDASFYRTKYYLYFGATPAVFLFLPWSVVTGHGLPEWFAGGLLASAAFLLALAWLAVLRREFFPAAGGLAWIVVTLTLGLGTGLPVVLRPAKFYQIAILSGLACSIAALLCLTLALRRPAWRLRWLAVASLAVGLAAGSRPNLIPGSLLGLGVVAGWLLREAWRSGKKIKEVGLLVLAAGAPVGACFAAIGWYNWMRFDSPFEFGLHYQLGSNGDGFPFTLQAFWRNLRVYYLTPPDFSWFFPYFFPGPKPPGSNAEEMHGMYLFLPILVLLLTAAFYGLGRWRARPIAFMVICAATVASAGTTLLIVGSTPNHSDRYALDFHPYFAVLGLLAVLACNASTRRFWRWLGRVALVWLGVVCVHGFFIPFQTHGYFRDSSPADFARFATACNRIAWPLHRLTSPVIGGAEFRVVFPDSSPGRLEPILEAGTGSEVDSILLWHTGNGRARLIFDHQGFGGPDSEEFELRPGTPRSLEVSLGTFIPPAGHPWHAAQPAGSLRFLSRVSLRLDGKEVLGADSECFSVSSNQLVLGRRNRLAIGAKTFAGRIELQRELPPDWTWLAAQAERRGPLALRVMLPRDRFGVREPLFVTGARGRQDLLLINYFRDGEIRLTAQHEGDQLRDSEALAVDYLVPHEFVIHHGAEGFAVWLDGRRVFSSPFAGYAAESWQIWAGCAPWRIDTTRNRFGGKILSAERRDIGSAALLAAGKPFELSLSLPGGRVGFSEPLITTGVAGRGDSLFVRYLDPSHIVLGFDHWGVSCVETPPIAVDYRSVQTLAIAYGAFLSPSAKGAARLRLELNGAVVLDIPQTFHPTTAAQVRIGENHIGASTSGPRFTGEVLEARVR